MCGQGGRGCLLFGMSAGEEEEVVVILRGSISHCLGRKQVGPGVDCFSDASDAFVGGVYVRVVIMMICLLIYFRDGVSLCSRIWSGTCHVN